jgi:hypothetical protein
MASRPTLLTSSQQNERLQGCDAIAKQWTSNQVVSYSTMYKDSVIQSDAVLHSWSDLSHVLLQKWYPGGSIQFPGPFCERCLRHPSAIGNGTVTHATAINNCDGVSERHSIDILYGVKLFLKVTIQDRPFYSVALLYLDRTERNRRKVQKFP